MDRSEIGRNAARGLSLLALLLFSACDRRAPGLSARGSAPATSPRTRETAERLPTRPGTTRRIAGRETHRFGVDLERGTFLHLTVQQQGVDVVVAVFAPGHRPLFVVDSLTGSWSAERVYLLAEEAGVHEIEIRPFSPSAAAGTYRIEIAELRTATAADRLQAEAEKDFALAQEAERGGAGASPRSPDDLYREAARLSQKRGDGPRQADALFHLAVLERAAGHSREAVTLFCQALPLRPAGKLSQERAVLLNYLGAAYRDLGDTGAAKRAFDEAIGLFDQIGFRPGKANALLNLGALYRQEGRSLEALDCLEQARLALAGQGYRPTEVGILNEIGTLYAGLGETDEALRHHRQALALVDRERDFDLWADTLNHMGNADLEAKRFAAATRDYEAALALRQRVTNPRGEAVSLIGLGLVAERRGDSARALLLDRRALAVFVAHGDALAAAITLNNLGWLYGRRGAAGRALDLHRQALERARALHDPDLEATTLFGIAKAERQLGDLTAAGRTIRSALALIEDLRRRTLQSDLRISYLASREDCFSFFVDLLMEQHRRRPTAGYDALALGASEQSRARQLLDALAENRERLLAGVSSTLLERQRAAVQALHEDEDRQLSVRDPGAGPRAVATARQQQETDLAAYRRVEEEIRRASPWYASLSVPRPLALQQIQHRVVDPDTLLLEIHLGSPHSYLWVVTPARLRSFVLPDRAVLEAAARKTYGLLAGSDQLTTAAAVRRAAADLSFKVLGPAASLLGTKRLVVVTSGALQYIPFAALPEPSPQGPDFTAEPLVARHEVVSLPSASVLAVLRQQRAGRRPPTGFLAVVADPVLDPDDDRLKGRLKLPISRPDLWDAGLPRFGRLPFSGEEASAILTLAGSRNARAFVGFDANRQLVLSGQLAGFRIVHFSTHGWLDARHPELSALLLSRFDAAGRPLDGRLRMHEIYELEMRADLVVLGGCQTALGREVEGEGLMGMTRGFLYAGARRVLVSLWSVADHATAELMKRFYRALLVDGRSPAAALRQAQLSMLAEERWRAPFHWAGFELQGDWD